MKPVNETINNMRKMIADAFIDRAINWNDVMALENTVDNIANSL